MNDTKIKKDFLFSYRNKMKRIKTLEEKLYFIKSKIENINAIDYSKEPGQGSRDTNLEYLMDRKISLENEIQKEYIRSLAIKQNITKVIDLVDDPLLYRILDYFYLDMMMPEKICHEIDRSERQFYRLYKKAIESVPIDSIKKCQLNVS